MSRTIAVMLSRFPTVTETFILRELVEMERQGQPIRLVPMIEESPPVIHESAKPWIGRALYIPFLSAGIVGSNLLTLLRNPLHYANVLARLVAGTIKSPGTLARTLVLFPKSVALARRLTREGIRHIHVHFASHPATMALIVAQFSAITFSFTVHAQDIQVDRSLLDWKMREARFVRACTGFNKRFLEELYPRDAAAKIIVVHYGVDPDLYRARHATGPSARPVILSVASHKPYKGLTFLIEAARILRDEGLDFEVHLIGAGPLRGQLERQIRDARLEDRVLLLGPRGEEEVAQRLADAAFFVLPSIVQKNGKMEGMPNALIEAMASGCAVISTPTSGIPELVDPDVNGLLVAPENARALADAMRTLLTDPERALRMGEHGRERVRRDFDIHAAVAQLLKRLQAET